MQAGAICLHWGWWEEMSVGESLQVRYEVELVKVLGFTPAEAHAIGDDKLRELYLLAMIDDGDAEAVPLHKKKTTLQKQREG